MKTLIHININLILTLCFISQNYACDSAGIPIQLARATNYRLHDDVIRHIGFFKIAGEIRDEIAKCGNIQNIENRIFFFLKNNPQYNSRIAQAILNSVSRNFNNIVTVKESETSQTKLQEKLRDYVSKREYQRKLDNFLNSLIKGDQEKVEKLVQNGMNVNIIFLPKYSHRTHIIGDITPLAIALNFDHNNLVQFLLKQDAAVSEDELNSISTKFPDMAFDIFKQKIKGHITLISIVEEAFRKLIFHYLNQKDTQKLDKLKHYDTKYLRKFRPLKISLFDYSIILGLSYIIPQLFNKDLDNIELKKYQDAFSLVLSRLNEPIFAFQNIGIFDEYANAKAHLELIFGSGKTKENTTISLEDLIKIAINTGLHFSKGDDNNNQIDFIKQKFYEKFGVALELNKKNNRCCNLL